MDPFLELKTLFTFVWNNGDLKRILLWKILWYRNKWIVPTAVKNNLISEKMNCTLPNPCVACKITLNETQVFLYSFYNPPISGSYRYAIDVFQLLLRNLLENKPIVICGNLDFPDAHWKTLYSPNETEDKITELFEKLFWQIIDFPTCGNNILDTASYQNCHLSMELDKCFQSIYDLTHYEVIHLSIESSVTERKPWN